jgi:hypothetical protein
LAAFAGTKDELRGSDRAAYEGQVEAVVRKGIDRTKDCSDHPSPPTAAGAVPAHYGVDKTEKRMNDSYRPCAFEELAARAGLKLPIAQCPNH